MVALAKVEASPNLWGSLCRRFHLKRGLEKHQRVGLRRLGRGKTYLFSYTKDTHMTEQIEIEDVETEDKSEPTQEAHDALEILRPFLDKITPSELRPVRLLGALAVKYAQRLAPILQDAMPELQRFFKILPEESFGMLSKAASAFWSAQRAFERIDPSSQTLQKLYKEAGELKETVIGVLQAVGRKDPEVQRVLALVKPGTGYLDRADDLLDLHAVVKTYQETLLKKELLSLEEIQDLTHFATALTAPTKGAADLEAARSLRDRAWTFFLQIQGEAERYLTFLYAPDQAKLASLPRLYPAPVRKAKP